MRQPAQCDAITLQAYVNNYRDLVMSDYLEVEARLRKALTYKRQHPTASFR
jgi:hypothetical protein